LRLFTGVNRLSPAGGRWQYSPFLRAVRVEGEKRIGSKEPIVAEKRAGGHYRKRVRIHPEPANNEWVTDSSVSRGADMQAMDTILRHLRRLVRADAAEAADDAALLRRFADARDDVAFSRLVERHGPMVLGVCRRLLGHEQDAEDAFQATFLILARKAGGRLWRSSVAPWLHTVARRVCRRAAAVRAQQLRQERRAAERPRPEPVAESSWAQLQAALDDELQRLPDRYRAPLLLCCLAGLKQDEAARQLNCSEGALRGRLHRGRELLRARLARRGLAVPALAAALLEKAAPAAPGPALAAATVPAALSFAAGSGAEAGSALLARGVLQTMLIDRLKWVTVILAVLTAAGAGAAWGVRHASAERTPAAPVADGEEKGGPATVKDSDPADWKFPEVKDDNDPLLHARRGVVVGVDLRGRRVLARMERAEADAPFAVDPQATMSFTAPWGARSSFKQKMSFADLRKGMIVQDVERSEDGRTFVSFDAAWPSVNAKVKAADREKRTLTVENAAVQGGQDVGAFRQQMTFALAREAQVTVDGFNLRPFLLELEDVPAGRAVVLELGLDRSVRLVSLDAGRDVRGTVRAVDGAKQTILVAIKSDEREVELALEVQKGAPVRLDGKAAALGALKKDMPVLLRLDADRRTAVGVWAGSGLGLNEEARKAYNSLKAVTFFAVGGVGDDGEISQGEQALRLLLKEPDRAAVFARLARDAGTEGRLYALVGLRLTDEKTFLAEANRLANSKAAATLMSGCIRYQETEGKVVGDIAKGQYR
jgi:RNA polymerase sigma factor (sigma-70 family)